MHGKFATLRFKLAVLNLMVFGVIFTSLCVAVFAVRAGQLRESFDERLLDKAETIIEAIGLRAGEQQAPQPTTQQGARLNPFRFPGYSFALRRPDGDLLERSANLGAMELPFSEEARRVRFTGAPVLETVRRDRPRFMSDETGQLRLITLYQDRLDMPPFYLQVGHPLDRVEQSIRRLRRLLLVVIPLGLLLVSIASWWTVRRSLAPIGEIAREARQLTAARLDRRIEVPPGRDEVSEMVLTINEMLGRLEKAFLAQERFIADASHELKTPLALVLTETQVLLQRDRTPEEYDRFVAGVQDQLRHLSRMVDSMLTLTRADAGFPLSQAVPVSINEVVTEAVQHCEPLASHREVRLIPKLALPTEEEPEPCVSGDPLLLRAVVENLIRNAVRYSPAEEAVQIEVHTDHDEVIVSVRDQGPGIPPDQMERVFDRFFQVSRRGESPPGAGLGLAIAKGVATLHQGAISLANRPSGGCEFILRLPLYMGG